MAELPIFFWISAVAAVLLAGIGKAGFGGGAAMAATPLMALTIPVADAAAIMLPLLITCDLFSVHHYRSRMDRPSVQILLAGAVLGIAAGTLLFGYLRGNERILRLGVGLLAIVFVIFQALRTAIFGLLKEYKPHPIWGIGLGALSGFTSTLIHAGGPPVAIYLLPQKLPRDRFVGTTVIYFAVLNALKLIPYSSLGLLHLGQSRVILVLAPLAFVGVRLGIYLNQRFSEAWFSRVIYVILLLTGLKLIF